MSLPPEIEELIASKDRTIAVKDRVIAEKDRRIAELETELAARRRQVGQDSSNSSKPPSSDGLKKKPRTTARSLRGRSGKASGGQEGHKGDTLRQVADPDFVVPHDARVCEHCCTPLEPNSAIGHEKRQVFDLPGRPLLASEHRASIHRCENCQGLTKAAFPEGVVSPVQYGERIRAAAIYLNVQQLIPEDRVAQALNDLFGAPQLCPASVVAWVGKKDQELQPVYELIGERVGEAKVRHLDETGYRVAGKLQWLHTTSSLAFTFYRAGEKRGAIPQCLNGGVVVHDHFLPYRRMATVEHAFCNAHILRELQGLIEFDGEAWAEPMRDMLLEANVAVNEAREAGATALPPGRVEGFLERYWAAVRLGLAFHRELPKCETTSKGRGRPKQRPGHNLLERLKTFKTETLRFLTDFDVPFTNNLAEQDLRMMKVKMKISGSFRTLEGAEIFARLRSVVSTARKQGFNILQILTATPEQLMRSLAA
jgi:transposase